MLLGGRAERRSGEPERFKLKSRNEKLRSSANAVSENRLKRTSLFLHRSISCSLIVLANAILLG